MDILYIVIPAYNEEETIQSVIDQWYPVIERWEGSRLVLIDDGSKDSTYQILEENAKTKGQLIPIRKKNEGHGATVLFGYNYALEKNADFIFQTDSDRQTKSEEFWQFWNLRNQYDMVIGWRKNRQDGFRRVFVTKVLRFVINLRFGVFVPDANTPFRLLKADVLRQYIELIPKQFNLSNVLLSVIYEKKKRATKYISITFEERKGGINSINIPQIVKIGKQAWNDFKILNDIIE